MAKRLVKSFTTGFGCDMKEVNKFLEEQNATPISISVHPMHDLFQDGRICNQWEVTVLIYEVAANDC